MRLIKCIIFLFIYLFKSQIEILCLFVAGDRNFKFWIKTNLNLQKFDLNLNLKKKTKLNRELPHGNHTPSSTGQWKLNENSNFPNHSLYVKCILFIHLPQSPQPHNFNHHNFSIWFFHSQYFHTTKYYSINKK